MAVISKELFYQSVADCIGCNILHPWSGSCFTGNAYLISQGIIGCSKYFFPLYLAQSILKWKDFSWKKLLKGYLRTMLYGANFVAFFMISNCLLSRFTGRLHYYNIGLVSGFVAGLPIFIESTGNRNLNTVYFFNVFVEAVIKNLEYFGKLTRSRAKDTLTFMTCSSILMYLFHTQGCKPYSHLWFYQQMKEAKINEDNCAHADTCNVYIFKGLLQYFGIGFGLEVVRFALNRFGALTKNPRLLLPMIFNVNNLLFGLVTGGYVGIFRSLNCLLVRKDRGEKDYHKVLAGFLAGATYWIKPNLQFGIISFTTILQLLIQRAERKIVIPSQSVGLLFAVLNGLLFHNRFMYPDTCPKYTINMVRVCSNNLDKSIMGLLYGCLFGECNL